MCANFISRAGTNSRKTARRIDLFTNPPLDSLDPLNLQTQRNDIGQTEAPVGENTE
jgi:hypothetical protein